MQQIAAEELGLPIDRVEVLRRRHASRGPYAPRSRPARPRSRRWARRWWGGRDAARQVIEIAAQRHEKEESTLSLKGGGGHPAPTVARGRSRRSSACSKTARSSAVARAAPTRRGCRCSRSACRSPRLRSTWRPARCASSAWRRSRRRPRHQPTGCVVAGRGRDHPGHRPHALGGAAGSIPRPDARSPSASMHTSCRRSPTSPRSSPTCWMSLIAT